MSAQNPVRINAHYVNAKSGKVTLRLSPKFKILSLVPPPPPHGEELSVCTGSRLVVMVAEGPSQQQQDFEFELVPCGQDLVLGPGREYLGTAPCQGRFLNLIGQSCQGSWS